HPDVHIIDVSGSEKEDVEAAESDAIKIEYIRRMQKEIGLKPYEAAQKVFIINDAHNLTGESANALLKTLEEPPKDSLIILVSSRPNLLFKTVISRCKVIKFYPLERKVLAEIMRRDYLLDVQAAHYLAYFCEGRIGEAVRLKDSGMLDEKNRVIDEFILRKPGGSGYRTALDRYELRRLLNIMCAWFRDVYMLKVGLPYSELINLDRKEELLKTAATYSLPDLDETLGFLSASFLYLEQNVNPRLLLSNLKVSVRNQ
ncbi:MAG: ATP-binding protein, partial [Deltaproteobacteria bacterium]